MLFEKVKKMCRGEEITIGKEYLEMIKNDTSKIMKCQEKIGELLSEIEENLAKLHGNTVKFNAVNRCLGVTVKDYLEIERMFYDNIFAFDNLNDSLSVWLHNCMNH